MEIDQSSKETLVELIKDARICMLTTLDEANHPIARPMSLQEAEFDGDLWFFTFEDSDKVRHLAQNDQVNVSFSDQKHSSWASLYGRAEIVKSRQKMEQLWNPLLKAWFPEDIETPGLTLLKVNAESAEYWDSPSSKVVQLFGMAKSAVTGKPYKPGEDKTILL